MKIDKEVIIAAVETSASMNEAAAKCGIHYVTFKKYATELGVFKTNTGRKGFPKKYSGSGKFELSDILDGKHPQYGTDHLRVRLIKEGILERRCSICSIVDWQGKYISMHLDHIDGNRTNHVLSNLRILCPNCHYQTDTFGSKKRKASVLER